VTIRDEARPYLVGVRVRDLAAEELDTESRHAGHAIAVIFEGATSRLARPVLVVALAVAQVGCGGSNERAFTEQEKAIAAAVGERFSIVLEANPSIGDEWRVIAGPDPTVVELLGESYVTDDPGSELAGAGGMTRFMFEARAAGTTRVEVFNCYRCLGDEKQSAENEQLSRTVVFTITVS
jgi:inhibitor of cysteine peptidase